MIKKYILLVVVLRFVITLQTASLAATWNVEFVGQIGGGNGAVAAQGKYAYIGEGPNLIILDVSDPDSPVFVERIQLPGLISNVVVSEKIAYLISGDALRLVDISNPYAPFLRGYYRILQSSMSNYYYNYGDLKIVGSMAYLAVGETFIILDISNPDLIIQKGVLKNNIKDFDIIGHIGFLVSGGIKIVDFVDPTSPTNIFILPSPIIPSNLMWGQCRSVKISNNFVFILWEAALIVEPSFHEVGISVLNISNLEAPVEVNNWIICSYNSWEHSLYESKLTIYDNRLYVALESLGLYAFDITNPANPTGLGKFDIGESVFGSVGVIGTTVFATSGRGVFSVYFSEEHVPIGMLLNKAHAPMKIELSQNKAYLTEGPSGLRVLDISNPSRPIELSTIETPGDASDVSLQNNLAYIADGSAGLRIIDTSNNLDPYEIGHFSKQNFFAYNVAVSGDNVFLPYGYNGLKIVDVSNPGLPIERGNIPDDGRIKYLGGIQVSEGIAYLANIDGFWIIDITNPESPYVKNHPSATDSYDVFLQDHKAYVAQYGRLIILDVSNPYDPNLLSQFETPNEYVYGVTVIDSFAYIIGGLGVQVLDVSDPKYPIEVGHFDLFGNDIVGKGGLLFVAGGFNGLVILRYTGPTHCTMAGNPDIQFFHHIPLVREFSTRQWIAGTKGGSFWTRGGPARICADDSESTLIELTFPDVVGPDCYDLKIAPEADEADVGSFAKASIMGNTMTFRYHHPRRFTEATGTKKRLNLQVIYTPENRVVRSYPIEIYRAPVVMVHGLWGDASTFKKMEEHLDQNSPYDLKGLCLDELTLVADYKSTNAESFEANNHVVPYSINQIIQRLRDDRISAGKADLVCHSMGGILARLYHQSADYQGNINRLITLNTPHSGTQMANFLLSQYELANSSRSFLSILPGKKAIDFDPGKAIDNLRVDSNEIQSDLNGSVREEEVVPSHSLTTTSDCLLNVLNLCSVLAYDTLGYGSANEFHRDLWEEEEADGIVPRSSQQGGLVGSKTGNYSGQLHTGSASNEDVIGRVIELLRTDPAESTIFSTSGFEPPTLAYDLHPPNPAKGEDLNKDVTGSVFIVNPQDGTIYAPGEELLARVEGVGEIKSILFFAGDSAVPVYGGTASVLPATFAFELPSNSIGRLPLYAIGLGNDMAFSVTDSISIDIRPTSAIASLTIEPTRVCVLEGLNSRLEVHGLFEDQVVRDLTYHANLVYGCSDPTIAQVTEPGLIKGLHEGETRLQIGLYGLVAEATVTVLDSGSWDSLTPDIALLEFARHWQDNSYTESDLFYYMKRADAVFSGEAVPTDLR